MQYLQSDPYAQSGTIDNGPGRALAGIGNVFGDPMTNALNAQKQALTAREIAGQGQLGALFAHPGAIDNATGAAAIANGIDPDKVAAAIQLTNNLNGGVDSDLAARAATGSNHYTSTPLFQNRAEAAQTQRTQQAADIAAASQLRTAGLEPVQITNPDGSTGWTTKAAIAQGQAPAGAQPLISPDMVKGAILSHGVLPQPGGGAPAPMSDDQRALAMPADAAPKFQVVGEDAFGNKQYGYPPAPPAPGAAPAPPAADASAIPGAAMNLHGKEFLATIDPQMAGQVQGIIEGRIPYPSGMLLKTPYGQKLATFVTQADPTFNASDFAVRQKTRQAFATGPQGQAISAAGAALGHLGDLINAVPAVGGANTSIPGNDAFNAARNALKGGAAAAPLVAYNQVNKRLNGELEKYYTATGGTKDERASGEALQSPNLSPDEIYASAIMLADNLLGKSSQYRTQYDQQMGPMAPPLPQWSPQAQATLTKIQQMKDNHAQTGSYMGVPTLPGVTPPAQQPINATGPVTPVGQVKVGKGGVFYIRLPGDEYDTNSWKAVPGGGK